jgi:hypothetical protein
MPQVGMEGIQVGHKDNYAHVQNAITEHYSCLTVVCRPHHSYVSAQVSDWSFLLLVLSCLLHSFPSK